MVTTSMLFLFRDPRYESEKPYTLRFTPSNHFPRTNLNIESRDNLIINDIRGREGEYTLERNGFTIMPLDSKLSYKDFEDEEKVVDVYLREVADGARSALGAKKVLVLEHIVR